MKKRFLIPALFFLLSWNLLANGVCIVNAETGTTLQLVSSDVKVSVTDQIATVTATSVFRNLIGEDQKVKFGFPMTETASAISLRWMNGGVWYEAIFSPQPQDTTLPGGGGGGAGFVAPNLEAYLGSAPLYFDLEQFVGADSLLTVELVYVDLLPYAFNKVSFHFPNNYNQLQSQPLDFQALHFSLQSQRTIDLVELLSHSGAAIQNDGHEANVSFYLENSPAGADYFIEYKLNADELGIFPFSTYLPDSSVICDEFGQGFFAFIVEPDPSENAPVIEKIFTLIIDKSGSMGSENKMQQAKDAAKFIVNNLNFGDKFNLVAFDNQIFSFKPDHVDYNLANQNAALTFINGLNYGGNTNISGAFSEAIPDFKGNNPDAANIIIFFTDGQATSGITSTPGILEHVHNLIVANEVEGLSIFTFGVGSGANKQLLTLLANNNLGLSEFLESSDLQTTISNFYLTIQNPVLLYPQMTFSPPVIVETHPEQLPNLFKGQQLIVVGRYDEPTDVNVHFSGLAFGQQVAYDYTIPLADSSVQSLQFLPRLWAKQKMKDLYQQFFTYPTGSAEAMAIEASIVEISLCYGVISPFTSFEDNTGGGGVTETSERLSPVNGLEVVVLPNPFRDKVTFLFQASNDIFKTAQLEIYDAKGRLVKVLVIQINAAGEYSLNWDGTDSSGLQLSPGFFTFKIILGDKIAAGKLVKM